MLDQISNAYIGSNISNRLYSINDLVWPNTTGNLWKITDNPFNKTISNFNVTYAGGQVDINWGKAISGNISSATNINHTFSGITNSGISVLAKNGASITKINCGTSSPRLSGTIDLSAFPNLQEFRCVSNDITAVTGYENNSNITYFEVLDNKITGVLPQISAFPNITFYRFGQNLLTGTIPNLSANQSLVDFRVHDNNLTGGIPNLSANSNLVNFFAQNCSLSGNIPNLSNNVKLSSFWVLSQTGPTKLTGFAGGSVSNTLGNFQAQNNRLTSTAVNAILAAFVAAGRTTGTPVVNGTCILNLGGTSNSRPTGQGLIDSAILTGRGWTVTTGT